jgi:hypothetical protein
VRSLIRIRCRKNKTPVQLFAETGAWARLFSWICLSARFRALAPAS